MSAPPAALLLALALALPPAARAFEVEQFRSGMDRDEVGERLRSWNFDRVVDDGDKVLLAYDLAERNTGRRLVFTFCNGKLVALEQAMQPSWKNFVTIAANYRQKYGPAARTDPDVTVSSAGEKVGMAIWWRDRTEMVGLRYFTLPQDEQLAVIRETPNPCFTIPR